MSDATVTMSIGEYEVLKREKQELQKAIRKDYLELDYPWGDSNYRLLTKDEFFRKMWINFCEMLDKKTDTTSPREMEQLEQNAKNGWKEVEKLKKEVEKYKKIYYRLYYFYNSGIKKIKRAEIEKILEMKND
jgi:hypothetical protein